MVLEAHVKDIMQALGDLPPEKATELRDFALFLRDRYGKVNNQESGSDWTDEDLRELSLAVWKYAEQTVPWVEKPDDDVNQRYMHVD